MPYLRQGQRHRSSQGRRQAQAKGPAEHAEVPVQAAAPLQGVQALAEPPQQVQAPVQATAPLQQEQVPVQGALATEWGAAPVEAKAPLQQEAAVPAQAPFQQEQVSVPATAPSPSAVAPAQQFTGGFNITSKSPISTPAGGPVEKQELAVSTESGGTAEVEVHLLSNRASPDLAEPTGLLMQSNRRADLSTFLDSDAFAKAVSFYHSVICVGLGSRSSSLSTQEIMRLVDNRAVHLCGILSRKPYVSVNTKLYGLPLGQEIDGGANLTDKRENAAVSDHNWH